MFEHKTVLFDSYSDNLADLLNAASAEGWELAATIVVYNNRRTANWRAYLIFKRPKNV